MFRFMYVRCSDQFEMHRANTTNSVNNFVGDTGFVQCRMVPMMQFTAVGVGEIPFFVQMMGEDWSWGARCKGTNLGVDGKEYAKILMGKRVEVRYNVQRCLLSLHCYVERGVIRDLVRSHGGCRQPFPRVDDTTEDMSEEEGEIATCQQPTYGFLHEGVFILLI